MSKKSNNEPLESGFLDGAAVPAFETAPVSAEEEETELRYLCNHTFWHYVANVHVQVGEEYNMALANRSAADIKGYIDRGELIPFRAPLGSPRIVFRAPDTLEWDAEKSEWKTVTHWNESYKQWGKRERRIDPVTGVEGDVWVFWKDEAQTEWAGETNFIDHNVYVMKGK